MSDMQSKVQAKYTELLKEARDMRSAKTHTAFTIHLMRAETLGELLGKSSAEVVEDLNAN